MASRKKSTPPSYAKALAMVTGSSLLVPLCGLATAPVLAQALGTDGRGLVAAAMAPNLLLAGGASLGLEHAVTFMLAKRPWLHKQVCGVAILLVLICGVLGGLAYLPFRGLLSGGDDQLAVITTIATFLAPPALMVGVLRGAAMGHQRWRAVAVEKVLNSAVRLVVLLAFFASGHLTVVTALVVTALGPIVAGAAYWRVLALGISPAPAEKEKTISVTRGLLAFGSRVWVSSISVMLLARMGQLLLAPLASVRELGLFVVAITISDTPYLVSQAVREFVFGTNSSVGDAERLLLVSRILSLLTVGGCLVVGISLPFWIGPLFGSDFQRAVWPTWILLASACVAVPGLVSGAALDSGARPGLRSLAMLTAVAVNTAALLIMAPRYGASGAALASLLSTLVSSVCMTTWGARALHARPIDFFAPARSDVARVAALVRSRR